MKLKYEKKGRNWETNWAVKEGRVKKNSTLIIIIILWCSKNLKSSQIQSFFFTPSFNSSKFWYFSWMICSDIYSVSKGEKKEEKKRKIIFSFFMLNQVLFDQNLMMNRKWIKWITHKKKIFALHEKWIQFYLSFVLSMVHQIIDSMDHSVLMNQWYKHQVLISKKKSLSKVSEIHDWTEVFTHYFSHHFSSTLLFNLNNNR